MFERDVISENNNKKNNKNITIKIKIGKRGDSKSRL